MIEALQWAGVRRGCMLFFTVVIVVFAAPPAWSQIVDLNGNGISDIWELIYGSAAADPLADSDSDGMVNIQESIAGTDPLNGNSVPSISVLSSFGTNLVLGIPGEPGKRYELQSLQQSPVTGEWSNWIIEDSLVLEVGAVATFTRPANGAARFFRIAVFDIDSDHDGVNDWEELRVGLDPHNPKSNGALAPDGRAISDLEFVSAKLAAQNIMSISAEDPSANQPDPGQPAVNLGILTVHRAGFPLNAATVALDVSSPGMGIAIEGTDFAIVPRNIVFPAGVSAINVPIQPLPNTAAVAPSVVTVSVMPGVGYSVGSPNLARVVIYPSDTPTGSGLTAMYFTNSSPVYSSPANFNPTNLALVQIDSAVSFNWSNNAALPIPNRGYYSVRWTGQVQPQYSELYYFVANTDDGVMLWINDQLIIDRWVLRGAADATGTILLQGGTRYNIRMEYFNGGGLGSANLSWYSASQAKQVIPAARLYPFNGSGAPSVISSSSAAVAFLGQPFTFAIAGANTPTSYTALGLPPGLTLNPTAALITGTPALAGNFQVLLTASNAVGWGASILNLSIVETANSVVRELWSGVNGANIADIPGDTPPDNVAAFGALEGITGFGSNYAERIRGYFTAPATGNYYFWIAASDSAELWISNDSEPCNRVRRAVVSAAAPTAPREWDAQPGQRSAWLALVAGQRYYVEILHKAGEGTNDHWSVGWRQDDTGTNSVPLGVVPAYLLGRYYPPPVAAIPGTLYTADMLAQANAASLGVGSATLRLSPDNSRAILRFHVGNLSSPVTGEHIHCDPYLNNPSQILFDIDSATPQSDGSYVWKIGQAGTVSPVDILEIIREGKAYINVHTVKYPGGEINGHFTLANGTQTFVPPPSALQWTDDHSSSNAAARFLVQATFGPRLDEIAAVRSLGFNDWIENQFTIPATHHLPYALANISSDPTTPYPSSRIYGAWWQNAITAPDQLRQRIAFALSEIMVVSDVGILNNNARAVCAYYDTLLENSFGNVRDLLEAVTLSPAMGLYLDMRGNDKGSLITGIHPNENYAREILQLFSIGLNRLWPDGTQVIDSQGNPVPTYNQAVIMGFASVFTGWNYFQSSQANGRLPVNFSPRSDYINPMVLVPTHHALGTKQLLDNVVLPQAWGSQTDSSNSSFDAYGLQDLEAALDSICNHQNIGPFLCRQLIQRLVTSNPSRDYLYRVVQKYNDNGSGVRGDLKAVVKAILLDCEARSPTVLSQPTFGKQREPLLRATALARAFPAPPTLSGNYLQAGGRTVIISTFSPHRLNSGDSVFLTFTDTSGQPAPSSQAYSVTVTNPAQFSINAAGVLAGTYVLTNTSISNLLTGTLENTNVIFANLSGHGLSPGSWAYLSFTSGEATNAGYQVVWTNSNNTGFAVEATVAATNTPSGSFLLSRLSAGGYTQNSTNITILLTGPHELKPGDSVFLNFTTGTAVDGVYTVASVPDPKQFTVAAGTAANQTRNGVSVYPLVPPPLNRSGQCTVAFSTWSVGSTDGTLTQTPLHSPTVFNFFYPDYRFPGALAAAGLTTPEFQLTSETESALQMNFTQGGLLNNTGNTNGLSSFVSGNGAIVLDLGPWMTPVHTANSGLPGLVDTLDTLLTGGRLSPAARSAIVGYVANTANFPFGNPPSSTQMRDRVRAVAHLLATSPDFITQR